MELKKAKQLADELRHQFKTGHRRKVIVKNPFEILCVDIIHMPEQIGPSHRKFRYILTAIDAMTKFAYAVPMSNKNADTVIAALDSIFKHDRYEMIWADQDTALYSSKCLQYLEVKDIDLYSTNSELKSVIVERFNRTLKERMEKIKTTRELQGVKYNWLKELPDVIKDYNNNKHSTTDLTPIQALDPKNHKKLTEIFKTEYSKIKNARYKPGDKVRLAKYKTIFANGYERRCTNEIFTINYVHNTYAITYKTEDTNGEIIGGKLYEFEIIPTVF